MDVYLQILQRTPAINMLLIASERDSDLAYQCPFKLCIHCATFLCAASKPSYKWSATYRQTWDDYHLQWISRISLLEHTMVSLFVFKSIRKFVQEIHLYIAACKASLFEGWLSRYRLKGDVGEITSLISCGHKQKLNHFPSHGILHRHSARPTQLRIFSVSPSEFRSIFFEGRTTLD